MTQESEEGVDEEGNPIKKKVVVETDKSDEHEDAMTCCDTLPQQGLYVSGDHDGLVKVWNSKKQLIREVKFVEPVNSVSFLNQKGDIIVGHQGNLSRLNYRDYIDSKMKVNDEDFDEFITNQESVTEDWLKKISQKAPDEIKRTNCCDHGAPSPPKEEFVKREFEIEVIKQASNKQSVSTRKQTTFVNTPAMPPSIIHQQSSIIPPILAPISKASIGTGGTTPHINIQTYDPNLTSDTGSQAKKSQMNSKDIKNQLADMRA